MRLQAEREMRWTEACLHSHRIANARLVAELNQWLAAQDWMKVVADAHEGALPVEVAVPDKVLALCEAIGAGLGRDVFVSRHSCGRWAITDASGRLVGMAG